jgi:hypothetical protein
MTRPRAGSPWAAGSRPAGADLRSQISNWRFQIVLLIAVLSGCAHHPTPGTKSPDSSPATRTSTTLPILYHRTGGIAGTDDRVVIWPDGLVEVSGKLMSAGSARLPTERLANLAALFAGWDKLKGQYVAPGVADAYTIIISFGDKSIEASDLAPDLPPQFRQIFMEIEAIAAQTQSQPQPEPAATP